MNKRFVQNLRWKSLSLSNAFSYLQIFNLLLPALVPSWRFFDTIAPSPRIEFTLLKTLNAAPESWQEFRPKPVYLPISCMIKRLFRNARWNETLFLISCAERLMQNPTQHSIREILNRIRTDLARDSNDSALDYLQFRLIFLERQGMQLKKSILFLSPVTVIVK